MTEYYFYPPFFVFPGEHDFADAWEAFCCKMLNLREKRDDIYRRTPPEDGIDLYCAATQTAYQCKSIDSGRASGFNAAKAVESLKAALAVRATLPWKKYVVCTNVNITGAAEAKLREVLPDLEIRPQSYWQQACEEHPQAAERHFRRLLSIPRARTEDAISNGFVEHYGETLREQLRQQEISVFLYSNRHEKLYRLPVSPEFKVEALIHVFRLFFRLPKPREYSDAELSVGLRHSLVLDGEEQDFGKTLRECGVQENSLVTYWTTIVLREQDTDASSTVMNRMNLALMVPPNAREEALEDYEGRIRAAFSRFDSTLAET